MEQAQHHNLPPGIVINRCVTTTKARSVPVILVNTNRQNVWIWQPLLAAELFSADEVERIEHRANMERLLHIRSTPIGPDLPSPREILHNLTDDRPEKPSRPVNFAQVRNYLISQKGKQKDNHDSRHQAKPLLELQPGQQALFLSPVNNKSEYIPGTILSPSSTPWSYKIEANGRIYHCTRQHIHAINTIQPFTRPCASQHQHSTKQDNNSLTRPPPAQNRAKTFIPGPSVPPKPVYKSLSRPPQPHSSNNNKPLQDHLQQTIIYKKVSLQDH